MSGPAQPTEMVTQWCPSCAAKVTMVPYNIGSGPEMSCPTCEWCWGADGQELQPLDSAAIPPGSMRLHL